MVGLTWLSAALRFHGLFANRFHGDEALYARWARLIAIWQDPLLQGQPVDKPPLALYLQALFYPMFGPVEWASRLPGFIASILLVPLVAILVRRFFRDELTVTFAALLVALSPLAIQFSATAFLDPVMATLLIFSFVHAAYLSSPVDGIEHGTKGLQRSIRWAGLWFGFAIAAKYQAWLFLPMHLGFVLLKGWRKRSAIHWLTGFLPVIVGLVLWHLLRAKSLSAWSMQLENFGGLRVIHSWELWPRFSAWLNHLATTFVPAIALFGVAAALLSIGRRGHKDSRLLLLLTFLVAYLGLHWLLAIPVWDRYLLPIVPWMAIVLAYGLSRIVRRLARLAREGTRPDAAPRYALASLVTILIAVQIPSAIAAREGQFPFGGRSDADRGAAYVAAYLADAPYGTVLYDHWFSWLWHYHLLDKRVYVSWFPHPSALAEDLMVFGDDGSRYLALPDSAVADPVKRAVEDAGYRLEAVSISEESQIDLFRVLPIGASQ